MANVATLFLFILSLTVIPTSSDGFLVWRRMNERVEDLGRGKKMVVGSRPPRCVNRCSSCRPCMAALVIVGRKEKGLDGNAISRREEDDSYYLLSWKCRCGDELFPP